MSTTKKCINSSTRAPKELLYALTRAGSTNNYGTMLELIDTAYPAQQYPPTLQVIVLDAREWWQKHLAELRLRSKSDARQLDVSVTRTVCFDRRRGKKRGHLPFTIERGNVVSRCAATPRPFYLTTLPSAQHSPPSHAT